MCECEDKKIRYDVISICVPKSIAPSHCLYCVHSRGSGMLSVLARWENGRVNEL